MINLARILSFADSIQNLSPDERVSVAAALLAEFEALQLEEEHQEIVSNN